MKLSVVIVNYNVKFFLDLTIQSALAAIKNLDAEILVIDNASEDGSLEFIQSHYPSTKFPAIQVLSLPKNIGFSKGNNRGIQAAKGEYILLLNPDTIVPEDCFEKCLHFLEQTKDAGGLGVRMLDGTGKFLPESKRGLPTPLTSLSKMLGLSKLFPKSKRWNQYHLGFLNERETHSVPVLSGAFFMIKKSILNEIGLLDETFFMYGEDIDLSYRITQAGYKNYYFPETKIIHFKGESTKKQSVKYIKVFYGAMQIFVQKHFAGKGAGFISFLLSIAIFLRAGIALINRLIKKLSIPVLDFAIIFLGFMAITKYWEVYNKWVLAVYPPEYYYYHIPFYIGFLLFSIKVSGGYNRPISLKRANRGLLLGGIVLLGLYGLAPKSMQFSRAILGLGILWSFISVLLVRITLQFVKHGHFDLSRTASRNSAILGHHKTVSEYFQNLEDGLNKVDVFGAITLEHPIRIKSMLQLGTLDQLQSLVSWYKLNELRFCLGNLPFNKLIDTMEKGQLMADNMRYRFVVPSKKYALKVGTKNESSEIWSLEQRSFSYSNESLIRKNLFDKLASICILFGFIYFLLRGKGSMLSQAVSVLTGKKTWVGTSKITVAGFYKTPIFPPYTGISKSFTEEDKYNFEHLYLQNFQVKSDAKVLWNKVVF